MDAAKEFGGAIPALPLTDTIRKMEGKSSYTIPRHQLVSVQTPQCFKVENIQTAYRAKYDMAFTDDASVACIGEFSGRIGEWKPNQSENYLQRRPGNCRGAFIL